ncbi:MAG: 6-phosphogluconolactonase [Aestuariivirgaceae bacterium]
MNDRRFETPIAMAEALAADIAASLSRSIAETGSASLVVSGGSTPRLMFDELSRHRLPWNRVKISLADERLVPAADPDSNERLVREHLLTREAQAAVFIPLWQGEGDPVESAVEAVCNMDRPFAMVVLGLGEDGHVASLFPGMPYLGRALDRAANNTAVFVPGLGSRQPRVSLTISTLLDTRRLALSFTGETKRRVFERALAPGAVEELPVRAILRQTKVPADVYWSP